MNTETREHISSLMDGEVSRETGRFLVRRLGADEELRATWARYHLVRDCLRHQEGGLASNNLAVRVQRAIERETPPANSRKAHRAWMRPAVGMAIAASVALMAVVAVGPESQSLSSAGSELAGSVEAPSFTSPQGLAPAPISEQASLLGEAAGDSRMNAYLLRHYQAAGSTGGKGFVTFVPIVIRPAAVRAESSEPVDGSAPGLDEEASARPQ
jgi:sigma-E factor negative regulatory protein RseA